MVTAQDATDLLPSYTRLHITPLDPELLKVVLSSSVLPKARNISYHSIESFPEKRYGFVDLPVADAEKIKKKLHGAVLKGQKIRVEQARPETRQAPLGDAAMAGEKAAKKEKKQKEKDKSKKRKRDAEEVVGVELEAGRRVKRGWTVPDEPKTRKEKDKRDKAAKDKKKRKKEIKSKYTDHAECLVKTVLPKSAVVSDTTKRKKSKDREVVIHEFEKTTKFPSFLKDAQPTSSKRKANLEFVDGKGWVDQDGAMVEAVRTRSATRSAVARQAADSQEKEDSSSSSEESSEESEDEEAEASLPVTTPKSKSTYPQHDASSTSKPQAQRSRSSSAAKQLTIKIPPPPVVEIPKTPQVHPLEALYKKPRLPVDGTPAAAPSEPFSFFGSGNIEDEGDDVQQSGRPKMSLQVPMTPFTRLDFERRGVRSAAPTPDTAHPNKMFRFWPREDGGEENIEEEQEEEEDEEAKPNGGSAEVTGGHDDPSEDDAEEDGPDEDDTTKANPETDFQKWFWENRGDLNRSWKKRRKTAAKEKRYRENKARAERAI
jgi:hypothetical protein